jgi:RNA polymerase sigma-70 factor (ECF subfamily)
METVPKQAEKRQRALSPEELFEAYRQQGDKEALKALAGLYGGRLYSFAFRILRSRADAEEALQEMWIRVHEHRAEWVAGTSIRSWLFRILRNWCLDILRKRGGNHRLDGEDLEGNIETLLGTAVLADRYQSASSRALDFLLWELISTAIEDLSPEYGLLILYSFDRWSYAEMAEAEGIPEKLVKSRLYQAREKIKEYLARHGYEVEFTKADTGRRHE